MGAQFQPCQEVGDREPEINRTPRRQASRFKLCASVLNLNDPPTQGIASKFKHNRLKINNYPRASTISPSSSRYNTPQIGSSQVDLAPKNRRAPLDSSTLKRREGLGKMLSERLGLIGGQGQDGERRQRMAEVVEKICLNNQEHLIDLVDRIENNYRSKQDPFETQQTRSVNAKLEVFLESVSKAELDFLDMVYHNDAQLYGPQRAFCSFSRNLHLEQLIDIKKLIIEEKEFAGSPALQYEKLKSKGLDLLRKGKVCFFVLAGGKCSRFLASRNKDNDSVPASYRENSLPQPNPPLSNTTKEFTPLNIPSQRCILELLLHRFIALSELVGSPLTLYLAISPDKIEELKQLFQRVALDPARLTVFPFAQKVVGAVDVQGRLIVEDGDLASLWSMGTGDMWNILSGDKELNFPDVWELRKQGFQYLQVLGTSNALEKCFDCFALGVAAEQNLDWTTKVVESYEKSTTRSGKLLGAYSGDRGVESKVFLNESGEVYVCDPQEIENYPQNCRYTFMNSSLFKIEYLCSALTAPGWQGFCARKKTHLTQSQPPFSRYRRVISYQKDYTDIFRLAASFPTRWKAILCDQRDYYPLVYHSHGHSDIQYASLALSDLHKSYLGVGGPSRVEIDPHVSLQGEGLDQLRKDIANEQLTEQDWIFIQHNPYK